MTGTILHSGATDTKHFGLIACEDGVERHFEEPFAHLDDRDRALETVGQTVTFQTSARHPGLAFNVATFEQG